MTEPSSASGGSRLAPTAAVGSFVIWGVMPLLFQFLSRLGATSVEILVHRAVWAIPFSAVFVSLAHQWPQVARTLRTPKALSLLALSAVVICANWLIFIWAVNHHRTLESSLGYYVNPLLNMAVGALLFREKIDRIGMAAIGLALVGVAIQTAALGRLPLVSIMLALSFLAYSVLRRQVTADAQTGLFIECLMLGAPALAYMVWLERSGGGHFFDGPQTTSLLIFTGLATATPLMLFAWAARRITFSLLGFLQFIGPTLQFLVGYLNGEPFTAMRAASFVFIWAGAGVFVWGVWRKRRQSQPA